MTLIEKMKTNAFSTAEAHVVNFILDHSDEMDHMTLEKLADLTYTSNATIIRLCRKLGFNGFRAFRMAYVKEYEMSRYHPLTVNFSTPFGELNNRSEVFQSLASLYKETIDVLTRELDLNSLQELAYAIKSARRVYMYGVGDSMITVKAFVNKLVKLDINVIISNEYGDEISHGYNVSNDDLVFFVSYGLGLYYTRSNYAELFRSTGNIAVLTANEQSPIYKRAKYKVLIEDLEDKDNIATFYSQFSFEFILNYLYSCLCSMNYKKNSARKSIIARLSNTK